ncbi:clathrin coat assembly protein AP180 isoform X8 [Bactrocera dorsalis]|uniref:Clathrin coat assembly protein AP180 isoform X8 n=1 Tax=Bactrocera dorsalis TaxID=27457 RepID=A0A6I9VJ96_BACDO|nr:clathrin coat assembly protein AP180 isoform X8 [Bactrocera dorsalis]
MYFSDVIYLSFLMILLFIILYKGFKHQAESHVRTYYQTPEPRRPRRPVEIADRQGNIFTIANESANNPLPHRFSDFFYVEPSAEDAARIRAQLEKDEKDLPTYEEVMAMSAAQTAAGTLSPPPTTSTTSVATTDTTVPPYSEVDRNGTRPAPLTLEMGATARPTGNVTAPAAEAGAASTSRAAAAAATSTATAATVVTIANSVSNTSV